MGSLGPGVWDVVSHHSGTRNLTCRLLSAEPPLQPHSILKTSSQQFCTYMFSGNTLGYLGPAFKSCTAHETILSSTFFSKMDILTLILGVGDTPVKY